VLELVTNPSQSVLPRIVEEGLEMLIEASFYMHRLFGSTLRVLSDGPPAGGDFFTNLFVAKMAVDINAQIQNLDVALFPPVLQLEDEPAQEDDEEDDEPMSIGGFLLPSIVFMSLLFVAQGVSEDIWKEKEHGTLRRVYSSPQHVSTFLLGKLLAGSVLMLVIAAIGLSAGWLFLDLGSHNAALALLWCAFSGSVMLVFFTLLQTLAKNERAGSVLTSIVLFPLMMLGGSFFPLESMPTWMAAVGHRTPNGLALTRLNDLLRGEIIWGDLLVTVAVLLVPAALAFHIILRRLRSAFAN
jgi:ABC-type multidrug transport system permease subunit